MAEESPITPDMQPPFAEYSGEPLTLIEQRPILQVVDGDGNFLETLDKDVEDWDGFKDLGFDYFVVAVLGCQSSGKSTLLNRLFGTNFNVMNARMGRRQTTLGVWLGQSGTAEQRILVLDVEGTDSRERGEDHGAFERKTSLFSLALSEILIINMWCHDIGRFDGANYSLLKIVFELNLQLFQHAFKNKTLLLFIFRDHSQRDDDAPLRSFVDVITTDMDKIWTSISKPEKFAESTVSDFFDFSFVSLPPRPHAPEKFDEQCGILQQRFLQPDHPRRILNAQYKKDIPADGFPKYAADIWQAILLNKDLNLPSQKEMLAMFRCDQISQAALETFQNDLQKIRTTLDSGDIVQKFGEEATSLVNAALETYDEQAKRYHAEVAKSKRQAMADKMNADLAVLFHQQLKLLVVSVLRELEDSVAAEIPEKECIRNFAAVSAAIEEKLLARFSEVASQCLVEEFAWNFKQTEVDVRESVKKRLLAARSQQLDLLLREIQKRLEKSMASWLSQVIEKTEDAEIWPAIGAKYSEEVKSSGLEFSSRLLEMGFSESESQSKKEEIDGISLEALRRMLREKANNVTWLMERRFNKVFKLDSDGLPRRWAKSDNVKAEFLKARQAGESILDKVSLLRLNPDDRACSWFETPNQSGQFIIKTDPTSVPEENVVLPLHDTTRVLESFRDGCQGAYLQALSDQENSGSSSTTAIAFIAVVLLLGWNEIWWVLSNPFLLVFFVLFGGSALVLWQLNLFPVIYPIIKPVADIFLNSVLSAGSKYLNNVVNNRPSPQPQQQASAKNKLE